MRMRRTGIVSRLALGTNPLALRRPEPRAALRSASVYRAPESDARRAYLPAPAFHVPGTRTARAMSVTDRSTDAPGTRDAT